MKDRIIVFKMLIHKRFVCKAADFTMQNYWPYLDNKYFIKSRWCMVCGKKWNVHYKNTVYETGNVK